MDALAVVTTVNTRQLESRSGRIARIILFKSVLRLFDKNGIMEILIEMKADRKAD
jgi:hypothetical protein